jgi:hypothetical protein
MQPLEPHKTHRLGDRPCSGLGEDCYTGLRLVVGVVFVIMFLLVGWMSSA